MEASARALSDAFGSWTLPAHWAGTCAKAYSVPERGDLIKQQHLNTLGTVQYYKITPGPPQLAHLAGERIAPPVAHPLPHLQPHPFQPKFEEITPPLSPPNAKFCLRRSLPAIIDPSPLPRPLQGTGKRPPIRPHTKTSGGASLAVSEIGRESTDASVPRGERRLRLFE